MVGTQGPRLPLTELPSIQSTHCLGHTGDDNKDIKYSFVLEDQREVPPHTGQHCPGLVTGRRQGVCGQTTGTQVTVPLVHVQRLQGLEESVKVWPWVWTTPSYRQESHTGQQVPEGTGWEHWTGQGLLWQVTTSF